MRWDLAGNLTDLGTLPAAAGAVALGIGNDGTIVGRAIIADGDVGVVWSRRGHISELRPLSGSEHSYPLAVNNHSVVVGGDEHQAVLWNRRGRPSGLGMSPGGISSMANGINDHNVVVGQVTLPAGNSHAAVWRRYSHQDE